MVDGYDQSGFRPALREPGAQKAQKAQKVEKAQQVGKDG